MNINLKQLNLQEKYPVIILSNHLANQDKEAVLNALKQAKDRNQHQGHFTVITLPPGTTLKQLTEKDMNQAGWYRKPARFISDTS